MNGHVVTINANATIASVTIDSGGTLTEDGTAKTLTVSGGWTNNGTFTAAASTIKFSANQTLTGATTFNNLELSAVGSFLTLTIATSTYATTTGVLTLSGNSGIAINVGNLDVQGDISLTNTQTSSNGTPGGTAVLTILGTGDQIITGNGSVGAARLPKVVINKASGNLTFVNTVSLGNNWTFTSIGTGSVITTGSTIAFAAAVSPATITGSMTFNSLVFADRGSTTSYTISSGTTLTTTNLTLQGTSALVLNTGNINVSGDITLSNTQNHAAANGTAIVTLTGSGNQTITGNSTAGQSRLPSVVINKTDGIFTLANTVSVSGNFTFTSVGTGSVVTTGSTLAMLTTGKTLDAEGDTVMPLNNVSTGLVGNAAIVTLGGALDVNGNLTINTGSQLNNGATYNVNVAGNWTNNGTYTSGLNTTTFDGSDNSTIITGGAGTTQDFQNFTVAKTGSGIVQLSTNGLDVDGTLSVSSGTLDLNGQALSTVATCSVTGMLKLSGDETVSCTPTFNAGSTAEYSATSGTRAIKNWTYKNLTLNGSGGIFTDATNRTIGETLGVTAGTFAPTNVLVVTATTTVNGGTFTATGATLDLNSDVVISSGTFTAPTGALTVAGNWTHTSGTFTHSSGSVSLDGTDQTVSGSTTFYNLYKAKTVSDVTDYTLTFGVGATTTIATGGLLTLDGLDTNNRINLVSSSPGSAWYLTVQGSTLIDYVEVTDSDASGGSEVQPVNSLDTARNINWNFNAGNHTPTVSSLGPVNYTNASWGNDNTPTLTFTTADLDGDTVLYEIVISANADYSAPVIDYISALAAAGAVSYTPTALPDNSYYWEVRVSDGVATSSYSVANAGIAFKVDTVAPTAGTLEFSGVAQTTITASSTGASDALSGLVSEYLVYHNITAGTYSNATSTAWINSGLNAASAYSYEVGVQDVAGNFATSTAVGTSTLVSDRAWYFDKDSIGGTCSDTGQGTITQPFCSPFNLLWNNSWNEAQAGDTIYIRQGTYSDRQFWLNSGTLDNGTAAHPITIRAYPGETVVFSAGANHDIAFALNKGASIKVHDLHFIGPFEIVGYTEGLELFKHTTSHSNLLFDDFTVHNGTTGFLFRGIDGVTVQNSTFYDLRGLSTGIGDHSEGITVYGYLDSPSDNIVISNVDVHDVNDGKGGDNGDGDGVHIGSDSSTSYVTNVTLDTVRTWNCSEDGMDITGINVVMSDISAWNSGATGIKLWTRNLGVAAVYTLKNVLTYSNRETGLKATNYGASDSLTANIYNLTSWGNGEDGVKSTNNSTVNSNGPTLNIFDSIIGMQRDTDVAYYAPRTGAQAHTNFSHTNIYHTGSSVAITPGLCSPLSGKYTSTQYSDGTYHSDLSGGVACGGVYGTVYGTAVSPTITDPLLVSPALAFEWESIAQSEITSDVVTLAIEASYPWPSPTTGHYIELNYDGVHREITGYDDVAHTITFTPAVSSSVCGRKTDCRGVMVTGWSTSVVPSNNFALTGGSSAQDAGLYVAGVHCALADDNGGSSLTGCVHWNGSAPELGFISSGGVSDTTAPTVTAFTLPTISSSLIVPISSFTATDNTAVTGYLVNESASAPAAGDAGWSGTAQATYTFVTEGLKTLYAWAKDAANNISTSLSDTVTVDTTAPTISSVASSTTSTTATITWTTNESATSTVSYGLTTGYGTASTSASSVTSHSLTLTGLTESTTYHFNVGSQDTAGNVATSSDYTFTTDATPDTTAPTISSVSTITTPTNDNTPSFTFTSTEAGTLLYAGSCTPSSTSISSGSNTTTYTTLTDATYTTCAFSVIDAAGNNSATTTLTSFTVDTTPPTLTGNAATVFYQSQTITLAADSATTIRYTTDGSTPSCSVGTLYTTPLTITAHTEINAIACDAAGNASIVSNALYNPLPTSGGASSATQTSTPAPASTPAPTQTQTPAPTSTPAPSATPSGLSQPQVSSILTLLTSFNVDPATLLTVTAILNGSTLTPSSTSGQAASFTRDLTLNMTGPDVTRLQQFLNSQGFPIATTGPGSPGQETQKFGLLTRQALIKYQKANGITPAVGYFGKVTRGRVSTF